MSPLFPRLSAVRPRPSVNSQTFRASDATARPLPVAAKDRMMSGLRPYRSASTPQNGRNSTPKTFAPAAIAPTHRATSAGATPSRGRYRGVNAFS